MYGLKRRNATLRRAIAGALCIGAGVMALHVGAQEADDEDGVAALGDITVTDDPLRALMDDPTASSFGFDKPLLETPRSVSFISTEQIELLGISSVDDLTRAVPGTFTTTRYGLQGGINVRGVPADMYYRGMKRIQMQGHARTVLSAMDGIEVVKGPPSPIFGMGRIGGFQNMTPKSSRASTGAYLTQPQGFLQGTYGSYNRTEAQFGVGGPAEVFGRQAGYYVFGMLENSDSFVRRVGVDQRFIQATASVDNAIGPFRLEVGGQLQNSVTSGAYMNRVTQDLIDNGRYLAGQPMVHLDLDNDGMIGFVERNRASPVEGDITPNNTALRQRWAWATDESGELLAEQPMVPGVPQAMLDHLAENPQIDCRAADVLRSMPAGGPEPVSGYMPVGFLLDPCTVADVAVDYRGNGAWEREQNADQKLGYVDLIYDINPDFTVKNQLLYDNLDTFKDSFLPYGESQYIRAVENKLTVTRRVPGDSLPEWMGINTLVSANYRKTSGWIRSSGGDFDHRQDIMYRGGEYGPNTMFHTQLNNPDYATGAPDTRWLESSYNTTGLGAMADIDLFGNTNLLLGGRYDHSRAKATDRPTFTEFGGVAPAPGVECLEPGPGCPGAFVPEPLTASGSDSGTSWSVSLSHQLTSWMRPYVTLAESSLQLSSSNDLIQRSVITGGHIGEAELKEVGIKGTLFGDSMQWGVAAYEQTRNDVRAPDDPGAGADVSASRSRGIEFEWRWVPMANAFVSGYFLTQSSHYIVDSGTNLWVDGRTLGFQDVVDPETGDVVFPAEAFLWGGRAELQLPANSPEYRRRVANPEQQAAVNANYRWDNGVGLLLGGTYMSSTYADRGTYLKLPSATVFNAALTYETGNSTIRLNGYNVTDKRYFRGRWNDSATTLISVMPGARWELTYKYEFR